MSILSKKLIEVVGAAIIDGNNVLAMQRSDQMTLSGLWEFPGGKVEIGETETGALIREIKEELDTDIEIIDYLDEASYDYSFGTVRLKVYTAKIISGDITLKEHSDKKWLKADELNTLDWAPVDIPLLKALENQLI